MELAQIVLVYSAAFALFSLGAMFIAFFIETIALSRRQYRELNR